MKVHFESGSLRIESESQFEKQWLAQTFTDEVLVKFVTVESGNSLILRPSSKPFEKPVDDSARSVV